MKKLAYLLFIATLFLTSCTSKKVLVSSLNGPNPEQARFESVIAKNFKYNALQSKVKLSMGGASLNGRMSLESGDRFCLSVNAPLFGFEVARIEANRDSVLLVDKMDKVYSVVTLSDLTHMDAIRGYEVDALECLMLGRIFIPGKGQATAKDFARLTWETTQTADGQSPNSVGTYRGSNYTLSYTINAQGQLESTTLATADGKTAVWVYEDYQEIDKKTIATSEKISATNASKKNISAGLTMSNPSFGPSTWRDFERTDSYRRVKPAELGEIILKMIK